MRLEHTPPQSEPQEGLLAELFGKPVILFPRTSGTSAQSSSTRVAPNEGDSELPGACWAKEPLVDSGRALIDKHLVRNFHPVIG